MNILTLPSVATLSKLLLSPLLFPFFLIVLLPVHSLLLNIVLAALFVMLSLTDLMEGYFARRFDSFVDLGKHLDPVANRLLACSTLITLLAAGKIFFFWVIVLVGREIFVLGLRVVADERKIAMGQSWISKIKSMALMVFITYVILNPYQSCGFFHPWNVLEKVMLLCTIGLSLSSAHRYFVQFIERMAPWNQPSGESSTQEQSKIQEPEDKQ